MLGKSLQAAVAGQATGQPWDLSAAVWNGGSLNAASVVLNPDDMFFKPDGTKMYVLESSVNTVYAYDLSTAWDLTTATDNGEAFNLTAGNIASSDGITFKSDGTKMYVVDGYYFAEYTLSTAWDVSTASHQFDVSDSANTSNKSSIQFKSDGTKYYVFDGSKDLAQYTASTTWSVNSASTNYDTKVSLSANVGTTSARFHFIDGNTLLVSDGGNDVIHKYTLSTAWDLSTLSHAQTLSTAPETSSTGVSSDSTGSKIYFVGSGRDKAVQYNLATAKDLTTTSVADWLPNNSLFVGDKEINPRSIFFKPDGTKLYVTGNTNDSVHEYTLSTAWDVNTASFNQSFSVAAQEANPYGIFFHPDGDKMYIHGRGYDGIHQYNLSTAWDISTASFSQQTSTSAQDTLTLEIFFKPDGTKMYLCGLTSGYIYEYTLSTAWDISTLSYSQFLNVSSLAAGGPYGIAFKDDGTKMYVTSSLIYEYDLSTAWDISTATYNSVNFSVSNQETSPYGIYFKDNGKRFYITGIDNDAVFQYEI